MKIHLIAWNSADELTVDAFLTKEEAENSLASIMLSYKKFRDTINHDAMTDSQIIKAWDKWSESLNIISDVYVYYTKELSINTGLGVGIKL